MTENAIWPSIDLAFCLQLYSSYFLLILPYLFVIYYNFYRISMTFHLTFLRALFTPPLLAIFRVLQFGSCTHHHHLHPVLSHLRTYYHSSRTICSLVRRHSLATSQLHLTLFFRFSPTSGLKTATLICCECSTSSLSYTSFSFYVSRSFSLSQSI
jgi:hypothetical protein